MSYVIRGLDPTPFLPLFDRSDAELSAKGALRYIVDEPDSFPDRVSLTDLPLGERVLLVNHEHLPGPGPYRSRHAIFVAERAAQPARYEACVPPAMARRLLSVRAFDARRMIVDAEVMQGGDLDAWLRQSFKDESVRFIHVHAARRGCFLAEATRD